MEKENNSSVVIDIENPNSRKNNLYQYQHCTSNAETETEAPSFIICNVQKLIHDVYKNDFEPGIVSIGPHHQGKQHLKDMERTKWKTLDYILKANSQKSLHDYIEAIWELYPATRKFYGAKDVEIRSNRFVHMLLLDGCFVLASICSLEWSFNNPNSALDADLYENMDPSEYSLITRDFLLLENQIPFFVLKRIYGILTNEGISASLMEKFSAFLEEIFPDNTIPNYMELERTGDVYHLLHLCHIYLRPSSLRDNCDQKMDYQSPEVFHQWHQVIEYHVAGINFTKRDSNKSNPHSVLDVSFSDDVLQIPYIFIDEITATVLRNLIALEQTKPHIGNHISAYILFISQLVGTIEDVSLLVSKGIIGHHFESEEEVSNIFRSLGECVTFDFSDNYYLKNVHQNLEALYRSRMKWGVGWLRRAKSTIQVLS